MRLRRLNWREPLEKPGTSPFARLFCAPLRERQTGAVTAENRKGQALYRDAQAAFARIDGLNVSAEDEWRALLCRY